MITWCLEPSRARSTGVVEALPVIRGKRSRPRQRPRWLYGDRGYDYDHHRKTLRDKGIVPRTARKNTARKNTAHGTRLGKTRWVVERMFAWLHQFKRLRIRWEHRADIHLASCTWPASSSATASCRLHHETSCWVSLEIVQNRTRSRPGR
ncbi:transposase [Amycolatopsis tucumanensis]|uniref:transposase n=1 Tax=Amycolatopsis tucumanensis TaxID=401106 RepID=UPI003D71C08B